MNIGDLIKELGAFDKQLDVKCILRNGNAYDIVEFDIGKYFQGVTKKPFCKMVISNWDLRWDDE